MRQTEKQNKNMQSLELQRQAMSQEEEVIRAARQGGTVALRGSLTIRNPVIVDGAPGPVVLESAPMAVQSELFFEGKGCLIVRSGKLTLKSLKLASRGGGKRNANTRVVAVAGADAHLRIEACEVICDAPSSDESPYPKNGFAAGVVAARGGSLSCHKSTFVSPGFQARGIVIKSGAQADIVDCIMRDCGSSAVWVTEKGSTASCSGLKVTRCGGYGSLYCTFGAQIIVRRSTVTRGKYGIMALHEGSRMDCVDSEFAYNLWSGIASRWSGCGSVTRCRVHHNGANGFQIRKSCASGVIVKDSFDHDNHVDPLYAFKHRDLHCTEVARKGLPSRGISSAKVEGLELLQRVERNKERIERKQR